MDFNTRSRAGRSASIALLNVIAAFFVACGDGSSRGPDAGEDGGSDIVGQVEALQSRTGGAGRAGCISDFDCVSGTYCFQDSCAVDCELDSDCGDGWFCSDRSRCVDDPGASDPNPELLEVESAVVLHVEATPPIIEVPNGAQSVEIPVQISGDVPESGLAYRVEFTSCTDEAIAQANALRTLPGNIACARSEIADEQQTHRLEEGDSLIHIELPGPAGSGATVLRIITAAGSVSTVIRASTPVSGQYRGDARVDALGRAAMPVEFELATVPASASLSNAESVRIRIPVRDDLVFSPLTSGSVDGFVAELQPGAEAGHWVGEISTNYDLSGSEMFALEDDDRVQRFMRIELWQNDVVIEGSLIDRFQGMVQINQPDGDVEFPIVDLQADLQLTRRGDTELSASTQLTPNSSANQRPYDVSLSACNDDVLLLCEGIAAEQLVDPSACDLVGDFAAFEMLPRSEQLRCMTQLLACQIIAGTPQESFVELWEAALDALDAGAEPDDSEELGDFTEWISACDGPEYSALSQDWVEGADTGRCSASANMACLRAIAADIGASPDADVAARNEALRAFSELSAEITFGERMSAFAMDQKIRLRWLFSADALSEFDDAAATFMARELEEWETWVVNPTIELFSTVFEPSSLSVLADASTDTETNEMRVALLTELSELWLAAADVLTISAQRWNSVLDLESERSAKAREISSQIRELYIGAGVLGEFNRSAGANHLNGDFGALAAAAVAVGDMSKSHANLVFARDAELVLTTSVDPTAQPLGELGRRADAAQELVAASALAVESLLSTAGARAASIGNTRSSLEGQIAEAFAELVQLCGNRNACTADSWLSGACYVPLDYGDCGYRTPAVDGVQRGVSDIAGVGGQGATSSASRALLAIDDAMQAAGIAAAEMEGHHRRLERAIVDHDRLAEVVDTWARLRALGLQGTRELVDDLAQLRQAGAAALAEFVGVRNGLQADSYDIARELRLRRLRLMRDRGELSEVAYAEQVALLQEVATSSAAVTRQWRSFNSTDTEIYFDELAGALMYQNVARNVSASSSAAGAALQAAAQGLPRGTTDMSAGVRAALYLAGLASSQGGQIAAAALQTRAENIRLEAERRRALEQGRLNSLDRGVATLDLLNRSRIEALRAELQAQLSELDLDFETVAANAETSREELALRQLEQQGIFEVTQDQLNSQSELVQLEDRLLQQELQAQADEERDYEQLASAMSRVLAEATYTQSLQLRVSRAEFNVMQRVAEYSSIVVSAEHAAERTRRLQRQLDRSLALQRSPAVLFRFANDLKAAEARIERARQAMMNWLVAIEYYAVRPFVDLRKNTLLATSPDQLDSLVDEYRLRESACGAGSPTQGTMSVSLRRDALGLMRVVPDPQTEELTSPAEQFRESLAEGFVPVNQSIRYSSDANVGDLLGRSGDLLSANFVIDLERFGNLDLACNAKLASFGLTFVGDIGVGSPSFVLIYDGTASLRSCQPDMDELVGFIGADITSFAAITTFDNVGTAVSGLGGVNTPPQNPNILLEERPLGAHYTLVIDPNSPSNRDFDWDALEDIELTIDYRYQAFFSESTMCR